MEPLVTLGERTADQWIISLDEAKKNINIDLADSETVPDDLLQLYVDSATDEIENYTDRVFVDRTATIQLSEWVGKIELPVSPVRSVLGITFIDINGQDVDLDEGIDYRVLDYDNGMRTKILFLMSNFPELNNDGDMNISIQVQLGYLKSKMPGAVKRAALLIVSDAESYRGTANIGTNQSVHNVLRPYRKY